MLGEMRAFSIFAEVGSVQAAAARLYLTQSAVTRQIKRLEQELGTPLLDRRFKPPILTPAGSTVLERSRDILQQVAPESMSVHVFANTAIATGVFRAKGIEGGKPYVRRERFVDTWAHAA